MDVEKIGRLARIKLNANEIKKFHKDLKEVLQMFGVLDKVDVSNVRITMHPVEVVNVVRKDEPKQSFSRDDTFANEKNKEDEYFKGPKTIE